MELYRRDSNGHYLQRRYKPAAHPNDGAGAVSIPYPLTFIDWLHVHSLENNMGSYCNLVEERIAIMDEQAALLEQFAGDMYAIIELCDGIKRKLEELEKEEDAYDKQAGLGLPPLRLC